MNNFSAFFPPNVALSYFYKLFPKTHTQQFYQLYLWNNESDLIFMLQIHSDPRTEKELDPDKSY